MKIDKIQGFTLLELMVTMTIAGMVIVYAMVILSDLGKGFRLQVAQSNSVLEMILQKKRIESCLNSIGTVDSWTETMLRFKKKNSDSLVTIQFRNGTLTSDNRIIGIELSSFKLKMEESNSQSKVNNNKVLLWECLSVKSGLICGAVALRE